MKYVVEKDKIVVEKTNEFDIVKTLECGQVFGFEKIEENCYQVISMDKVARIFIKENCLEIKSKDLDYFKVFFDLDTDYKKINEEIINSDAYFKKFIVDGLRILRQDAFQTIVSFIVSANNNIKRIKGILKKMSQKFGHILEGENCFSFPTLSELKFAKKEDFESLGAGYRAEYLVKTIQLLQQSEFDINRLKKMPSLELKGQLLKLSGVGPKVADCILFFGFGRTDFFPVDTWIRKAYCLLNPNSRKSDVQIAKYYVDKFGIYSGYAQQYLYNYMINLKEK